MVVVAETVGLLDFAERQAADIYSQLAVAVDVVAVAVVYAAYMKEEAQ